MENKILSVIIVNFNQENFLFNNLCSLRGEVSHLRSEVIVIDNNSKVCPWERIKSIGIQDLKFIANKKNLGLSKAVNQGIKLSSGKYILILNPDIRVKKGALEKMIGFLEENPKVGLIGPKLVYADESIQYSARRYPCFLDLFLNRSVFKKTKWAQNRLNRYFLKDKDLTKPCPVPWVLGAALMVRKEAIKEVGLMDERFFLYFEDVDWAYRFWQKGWEVWYFPYAEMVHFYQRLSDKGSIILSLFSPLFWIHLSSAFKFYCKVFFKRKKYGKTNF